MLRGLRDEAEAKLSFQRDSHSSTQTTSPCKINELKAKEAHL